MNKDITITFTEKESEVLSVAMALVALGGMMPQRSLSTLVDICDKFIEAHTDAECQARFDILKQNGIL